MIPELDLKRLKLVMILIFILGVLVSSLFIPLIVGIYASIYAAFHIGNHIESENLYQAFYSFILGFSIILCWIIVSLYEKTSCVQEIRGKSHFSAISPWMNGAGAVLWGCFLLIQAARHAPVFWFNHPFFIAVFILFFLLPWCIDIYRKIK